MVAIYTHLMANICLTKKNTTSSYNHVECKAKKRRPFFTAAILEEFLPLRHVSNVYAKVSVRILCWIHALRVNAHRPLCC